MFQAYGPKMVPNHERDFPDLYDIPVPISVSTNNTTGHNSDPSSGTTHNLGSLQGAFEIPLLPGVIIDIWRENVSPYRIWATTPLDGIGFAVLERIHLEFSTKSVKSNTSNNNNNNKDNSNIHNMPPFSTNGSSNWHRPHSLVTSSNNTINNTHANTHSNHIQQQHLHVHQQQGHTHRDEEDTESIYDDESISKPIQAVLFGRHPTQGSLLMERIQGGSGDQS